MSEQKPSVGRIVLYHAPDDQASNGSVDHPAIITHVFSDDCVNLTTFPDNGVPTNRTSVTKRPLDAPGETYRWSWPPREG